MRGKKYLGIALALSAAMAVSACGSTFPELTEDQYKQTVEYAAGLLMRYSNNGQERLIYVDAGELEKQRKKEEEKAGKEAETQTPATKPAPAPTPAPAPAQVAETTPIEEADNFNPEAQTPEETENHAAPVEVTETPTEETTETSPASDPSAVTLSADQSEEIMEDIFLSYQGYMVSSTYPESSKSYVVNSDKGKKLLVLRFDLYNASGSSKSVNMIPLNLLFEIILNGQSLGYSSVTFLPNDLSSYSGTIDSKAHESVVVLTQIDEKQQGHIDSLGMIATIAGKKQTVNLK